MIVLRNLCSQNDESIHDKRNLLPSFELQRYKMKYEISQDKTWNVGSENEIRIIDSAKYRA